MAMRTLLSLCACIFLIGLGSAFAQNNGAEQAAISQAKTPAQRFLVYRQLALGSVQTKNYLQAYTQFEKAFAEFDKIGSSQERNATGANLKEMKNSFGAVCDTLASRYAAKHWRNDAFKYYWKAVNPYSYSRNEQGLYGIYHKMALVNLSYENDEKYEQAIEKYEKFLKHGWVKDPQYIMEAYGEIVDLYLEMGKQDSALSAVYKPLYRFEGSDNVIYAHRAISDFYQRLYREGNSEEHLGYAHTHFKTAIEEAEDPNIKALLYLEKAKIEKLRGKRGSYFQDYTAAIDIYKNSNDFDEAARVCLQVGQSLLDAEEYDKALTYLNEGSEFAKKAKSDSLQKAIADKVEDVEYKKIKQSEDGTTLDQQLALEKQRLEKEKQRNIFYVMVGLGLLLLIALISYINKRKANRMLARQNDEINRKNDEISLQKENIEAQKNKIEESLQSIKILTEIGQKITASLDVEYVMKTVLSCFETLTTVDRFGVAVLNEAGNRLEFLNFYEHGTPVAKKPITIEDEYSVLFRTLNKHEDLFLNDTQELSLSGPDAQLIALPQAKDARALVGIPLVVNNKTIGLLTVMSLRKGVYDHANLSVLKTLASYTSIAISNAKTYDLIKTKNKHITDSIRYGETIQKAVLPMNSYMRENLRDVFVLFRPKDIVSGDFYWFTVSQHIRFIAAVDCTGHGVPGAFMSMIGNTILNDLINKKGLTAPGEVLENLHVEVKRALRQNEADGQANDDGMDLILAAIHPAKEGNVQVDFAGAKRPLLYLLPNEEDVSEERGNRKSIGGFQKEKVRRFDTKTKTLPSDTILYLTSDGYVDQNNTDKKKFGTRRFLELLAEIGNDSLSEQHARLEQELTTHMGSAEQRDDITVIGVKL